MRLTAIPLTGFLALAACAAPDPWAGTSPLRADPAGLLAAVDLPPGLVIAQDGARLAMEGTRTDTGDRVSEMFLMEPVLVADRTAYRVAEADLDRVRQLQAQLDAWETDAPDATEGSIRVSIAACRAGAGPSEDARVTVWLRTDADAPLAPVARNVSVSDGLEVLPPGEACP